MNRYDGKQVKNWDKYVGHRCLIVEDSVWESVSEIKVLEVSPRGRVKFQFPSDYKRWEDKNQYLLIEDLGVSNGSK